MLPEQNVPINEEAPFVEEVNATPLNDEIVILSRLGKKIQSTFYKTLLRVLVYKVEMSHLVILIASLGLLYRGHLFFDHFLLLKSSEFSVISQASAESTPPKEKQEESKTIEEKKEEKKTAETTPKDEIDPLLLDENQIKVLMALAKKEKNIKETEQEADIEKQKKIVELAQENLNKRIEELEKVKKGIDSKKEELTTDEKKNIENITKIYETMKPAQSADILNKMELTSVTQIIKHMNPKKAAAIVASMEASKARLLTLEIIRSKDIEGKSTPETAAPPAVPNPSQAPAPNNPTTPSSETKPPEGANATPSTPSTDKA